MKSEKGSALAIVMLVLGVASLIGVALITQTNLDLQLTSSVQVYNKIFSAADGAVAIAFNDLRTNNRDRELPDNTSTPIYSGNTGTGKDVFWESQVRLMGHGQAPPGWDVSQFAQEYWRGEGKGERKKAFSWAGGTKTGGTSSEVHVAASKISRKN